MQEKFEKAAAESLNDQSWYFYRLITTGVTSEDIVRGRLSSLIRRYLGWGVD